MSETKPCEHANREERGDLPWCPDCQAWLVACDPRPDADDTDAIQMAINVASATKQTVILATPTDPTP